MQVVLYNGHKTVAVEVAAAAAAVTAPMTT